MPLVLQRETRRVAGAAPSKGDLNRLSAGGPSRVALPVDVHEREALARKDRYVGIP